MAFERVGHPDVLLRLIAQSVETALRDADDGEGFVTRDYFLADDVGIQIEMRFPERPADDGDWRGGCDVLWSDQAADRWTHAERFKEIVSDVPAKNVLRFEAGPADVVNIERADDQFGEDTIAVSNGLIRFPVERTETRF